MVVTQEASVDLVGLIHSLQVPLVGELVGLSVLISFATSSSFSASTSDLRTFASVVGSWLFACPFPWGISASFFSGGGSVVSDCSLPRDFLNEISFLVQSLRVSEGQCQFVGWELGNRFCSLSSASPLLLR
jgi:hypothetical protein